VYFGTQHAKIYLNSDLLGINCVTGMSCLFRRDVLEDAGGFAYLGKFLAEDYYLGKSFIERYVLWLSKVCVLLVIEVLFYCELFFFQSFTLLRIYF